MPLGLPPEDAANFFTDFLFANWISARFVVQYPQTAALHRR